ncbi:chemotaxis protein MotA [Alkalibacterium putridalgicola]|uniref:Chemotaxis protein MotA n=1 Tax=Alkalibacterium putridalgicola TaxID=426703 RepID=A0A1H7T5K5_9LACT|nr:motility protein A [Alkalibacterium putridalgicola]GEK89349.1 motility protein A [Alkalibacterium putridalgicola]SEL80018.1 chemotaxis protein MotA [Alkalibacterium putridalgicola]
MKRNILPLVGLVVGIGLIIMAMSQNSTLINYFDGPSLVITFFGSFSAILISFPLNTLKKVPALLKKLMFTPDDDRAALLDNLTELAKKSRTQGILAIEEDIKELNNPVLIHGLEMVVDGTDVDTIEEILNVELNQTEDRHSIGQEVFLKWGEFAPAFGMIGTLIGLIAMLGDLQDPSLIGTGMATALLTTFYGSFLANMVFLPIAKNLEMQTANELKTNEMIIEGVLALQRGDNPRVMEQKLQSFLSNADQKEASKAKGNPVPATEEL